MKVVLGLVLLVAYPTVPWFAGWGLSRVVRSRRLPWLLLLGFLVLSVCAYVGLVVFRWAECDPGNVCDDRGKGEAFLLGLAWLASTFAVAGAFWGRPRRERRPGEDLEPWNPTGLPVAPGDLLPRLDDPPRGP